MASSGVSHRRRPSGSCSTRMRGAASIRPKEGVESATAGDVQGRGDVMRYIITAWATEYRDEHELLGSVLRCVLRHPVLPTDVAAGLPDEIGNVRLTLAVDDHDTRDFWSALEGRVKPAIELTFTMCPSRRLVMSPRTARIG